MGFLTTMMRPAAISESEVRGPVAWLLDTGDGLKMSQAGESVDQQRSLSLSGVFACVRNIAEDTAKLPLKLYRQLTPRGKESARDEDLYYLLHNEPNDEMSSFDFRQALAASAVMWHGGFAEIQRDGGGRPIALWPLHPSRVKVKRDDQGRLFYRVRRGDDLETDDVSPRDMIHVKGFSDTGVAGFMITEFARNGFGIYLAAERFTGSYFSNGTVASGVLEYEKKMDPQSLESLRHQFAEKYAGAGNSFKPVALDLGGKFKPTSHDAEKSQLVESLQFRIEDVARWFRMPPHKIGHLLRATFSNIEHQSLEYLQDTLAPWLVRIEQEFNRKLLPGRTDMFYEHVRDAIVQADINSRYAAHQIAVTNGLATRNEIRDKENLNPYPGGDKYLIPQNMAVVNEQGEIEPASGPQAHHPAHRQARASADAPDQTEAAKVAMMPVFVDVAERMITREAKAITAKGDKATVEWLDTFYTGHRDEVARAFAPPVTTLSKLAGADPGDVVERYADMHIGESRRLLETKTNPQDWLAHRPAWIATWLTDEVTK